MNREKKRCHLQQHPRRKSSRLSEGVFFANGNTGLRIKQLRAQETLVNPADPNKTKRAVFRLEDGIGIEAGDIPWIQASILLREGLASSMEEALAMVPGTHHYPSGLTLTAMAASGSAGPPPFIPWDQCVSDLDDAALKRYAAWRGFSWEFCVYLRANRLVGLYRDPKTGRTYFCYPVFGPGGAVIAEQVFTQAGPGAPKAFMTAGAAGNLSPGILGSLPHAVDIFVTEGLHDAFAYADRSARWRDPGACFIATRGAGNDKLLQGLPWPQANGQPPPGIVLLCQNDAIAGPDGLTANERWIKRVAPHFPFPYYPWNPLTPHKDFNDWTRAGVTEVELHEALYQLKSTTKPIDPAPQSPPLLEILKASTKLVSEFSTIVLPRRQTIFDDWFKESDLAFIYAPRGLGKTWMAVSLGIAISGGGQIGPWISQVSWPVLYVDGEMMWEDDQSRISGLNGGSFPNDLQLHVLNHEVLFHLHQAVLNLAAPEAQDAIIELCLHRGIKVLLLDNLSCLFTGVPENDADAWEKVLPWLLDLRRRRIAAVIVHHTGINTLRMRGTSRREDGAGWAMRLDMLENCGPGSHFISRFTKLRGKIAIPDYQWHFRPNGTSTDIACALADRATVVLQWIYDGLTSCEQIAREMGITPGAVSKLATKLMQDGKIHKKGRDYAPGPAPQKP